MKFLAAFTFSAEIEWFIPLAFNFWFFSMISLFFFQIPTLNFQNYAVSVQFFPISQNNNSQMMAEK